jgi:hypothetical protein
MTRNPAGGTLVTRHVTALRGQLFGALAMSWALGGCVANGPDNETWRNPGPTAPPETSNAPEDLCADAGVQCYPRDVINALVADGGYPEAAFTAEGCVDSTTAQQLEPVSCGPYTIGTGVRRADTCCYYRCYSSPGCGRPFVVAGEARVAEPRPTSDWLREEARGGELGSDAAIGREWLRDALAEHASVASFSAFNLSLLALGAPAELVRASAAATLDEVYHARACFELASQYEGRPLGPSPLDVMNLQVGADLPSAVERAFLDGCIVSDPRTPCSSRCRALADGRHGQATQGQRARAAGSARADIRRAGEGHRRADGGEGLDGILLVEASTGNDNARVRKGHPHEAAGGGRDTGRSTRRHYTPGERV